MRKLEPPVIYSKERDAQGNLKKRVILTSDFMDYLDERIEEQVKNKLERCGFPEKDADIRKLVSFLENLKGCWAIVWKTVLGGIALAGLGYFTLRKD